MTEFFDKREDAYAEAFQRFISQGEHLFFTAPVASHYYVQTLSNGSAVLVLGGAGTATQPDGTFRPSSGVAGAFTMPPSSLRALAKTILAIWGEEDEPA